MEEVLECRFAGIVEEAIDHLTVLPCSSVFHWLVGHF